MLFSVDEGVQGHPMNGNTQMGRAQQGAHGKGGSRSGARVETGETYGEGGGVEEGTGSEGGGGKEKRRVARLRNGLETVVNG